MAHDFNKRILEETAHRPWPMPDGSWIMTQTWHDLLFAHWPIDAQQLARRIPPPLEPDLFDGRAWLAVVPFHMTNVAPRGVPSLPWVSAFPELNVRTYVRVADRPGVYFFSLDAGNPLAVGIARTWFRLPYYSASMQVEERNGFIHYRSRRITANTPAAALLATYRPVGQVFQARRGSLEYFLTERYCLYAVDDGRAYRLEIHHPPWPLQPAEATIEVNTMAEATGIVLPQAQRLLHFSKRQDVVAWPLTRLDAEDKHRWT
jgi:uncharacterized protein YqjF (DUF2071 family)